MKRILSILLGITLATYASAAVASDTTTIWLTKAGDNQAKVCTQKSCLGTVKVKYANDATWANAKDSYQVSSSTADAISNGGCITVHADGGITVSNPKPHVAKAKADAAAPEAKKESSKDEQKK